MATLEELQAQLAALRIARASGVRSIEFAAGNGSSRRIQYRDDHELASAIASVEALIAGDTGGRVHTILISTSKGM